MPANQALVNALKESIEAPKDFDKASTLNEMVNAIPDADKALQLKEAIIIATGVTESKFNESSEIMGGKQIAFISQPMEDFETQILQHKQHHAAILYHTLMGTYKECQDVFVNAFDTIYTENLKVITDIKREVGDKPDISILQVADEIFAQKYHNGISILDTSRVYHELVAKRSTTPPKTDERKGSIFKAFRKPSTSEKPAGVAASQVTYNTNALNGVNKELKIITSRASLSEVSIIVNNQSNRLSIRCGTNTFPFPNLVKLSDFYNTVSGAATLYKSNADIATKAAISEREKQTNTISVKTYTKDKDLYPQLPSLEKFLQNIYLSDNQPLLGKDQSIEINDEKKIRIINTITNAEEKSILSGMPFKNMYLSFCSMPDNISKFTRIFGFLENKVYEKKKIKLARGSETNHADCILQKLSTALSGTGIEPNAIPGDSTSLNLDITYESKHNKDKTKTYKFQYNDFINHLEPDVAAWFLSISNDAIETPEIKEFVAQSFKEFISTQLMNLSIQSPQPTTLGVLKRINTALAEYLVMGSGEDNWSDDDDNNKQATVATAASETPATASVATLAEAAAASAAASVATSVRKGPQTAPKPTPAAAAATIEAAAAATTPPPRPLRNDERLNNKGEIIVKPPKPTSKKPKVIGITQETMGTGSAAATTSDPKTKPPVPTRQKPENPEATSAAAEAEATSHAADQQPAKKVPPPVPPKKKLSNVTKAGSVNKKDGKGGPGGI